MASLLELALYRRNPQLGGLLGLNVPGDGKARAGVPLTPGMDPVPVRQPVRLSTQRVPDPGASVPDVDTEQGEGGFFHRLFGGGNDPNLSPEENERIRRQSLLMAGLRTLQAGGEGQTGLGQIATGILTGQQFAARAKAQAGEAAQLAEREEMRAGILASADLSSQTGRVAAVRSLLAAGFGDEAGRIIDVMGEYDAPQLLEAGEQYRVFDPNDLSITDTGVEIPAAPPDTAFQQVGDNLVLIDKVSGEEIKSWSNPDRLSSSELSGLASDALKNTTSLRKEFQGLTDNAQKAIALADAALIGPEGDPATGQTLVIALNKILDPDSTVRESEFARVALIGGIIARLEGYRNQVEQGQLPQSVEASVRAEIARLRAAIANEMSKQATFYTGLATQNGLNPDQVVRPSLVETLEAGPSDGDPLDDLAGLGSR